MKGIKMKKKKAETQVKNDESKTTEKQPNEVTAGDYKVAIATVREDGRMFSLGEIIHLSADRAKVRLEDGSVVPITQEDSDK